MKRGPENISAFQPRVEIEKSPEFTTIRGNDYILKVHSDKPYVSLCDTDDTQWAELSYLGKIDTVETHDETYTLESPIVESDGALAYIRIPSKSTAWDSKDQVWICRPDGIEMYYILHGEGSITTLEMLGGHISGHRNGTYPSRKLFTNVFNPEPTASAKPIRSANHPSRLNVTGAFRTGNKDGQFTPAPWYYAMQQKGSDKTLTMSLAENIDKQNFISFDYAPYEDSFSFKINYQGHTRVDGAFRTPSLLIQFADDPYTGIADYREKLKSLNFMRSPDKKECFEWHQRSNYCGWGAQVAAARMAINATAQDFATQEFYDNRIQELASHGVWLPRLTIDDKWQREYGPLVADRLKWPDLGGWIDDRHDDGQHVELWYPMWETEGVDSSMCILGPDDHPVAVDPTHPEYRAFLKANIRHALGPDGYNADGLKVDFSGNIPTGYHYKTHGKAWGAKLLHMYYKLITDTAHEVKPDALITTHSPHPQFADVTDVIRLNDIHDEHDIILQMQHRAKVAKAAIPSALIDTDNWPIEEKDDWREYLKIQPQLGIVSFYNNHLVLTEEDYAALRDAGFKRD
jgi:hypothetical protein